MAALTIHLETFCAGKEAAGMNVKIYRLALSLGVVLVVLIAALAVFFHKPQPESNAAYRLREYQEVIGIYRTEESEPFMTIDVYVSTLPEADQRILREGGIPVADDDSLQSAIEDFGS